MRTSASSGRNGSSSCQRPYVTGPVAWATSPSIVNEPSTVLSLEGDEVNVLREGKGDSTRAF